MKTSRKERAVAFIVARLSSSRMPAKHLRRIGDRSLLQWVVDDLRASTELDGIVLATVDEPYNLPLKDFADKNDIPCFWYEGAVDHVTTRLRRAAETFDADICVLVSGDCPLIFAPAIDQMIRALRNAPDADTVRLASDADGQSPALQGIVVNRIAAWQLADELADRPELKEHQFPVIGLRPERFHPVDVRFSPTLCLPHHRLSVDTLADFSFMNAVYDALAEKRLPFRLPEVVALIKERPTFKAINAHVHQRRLVETIKKVLFVVDAGGRYGFGHLTRSMELARQITERLGWPVHFVVDDEQARVMLEEMGCRTHWGALGRSANPNAGGHAAPVETIALRYDVMIVDIFDQRELQQGWRAAIGNTIRCIAIENTLPWSHDTDLIVLPNLLDKFPPHLLDDTISGGMRKWLYTPPMVVGGERYLILREAVRRHLLAPPEKVLDVLIYLHDPECGAMVGRTLAPMGIKTKVVQGFDGKFADDLARARILVSGFGVCFNEALALRTLPVCLPDSEAHREDAGRFYRHLGMKPLIVPSPAEIGGTILPLLEEPIAVPAAIQDGTPNIVATIAEMCGISTH